MSEEKAKDFEERAKQAMAEITPILDKYDVGISVEAKPIMVDTKKEVVESTEHTITQEDLDNNPGLEEEVEVGEEVLIPEEPVTAEELVDLSSDEPKVDELSN